ncbi:hypothetical protein [Candidatus Bandiella euplotis]|uniref:hypothetical protein n=1 Tax=Candidatus Bandiella euplotis TaxID=1664265 RepID=UPI002B25D30A|nr:hypothetical protein [Candidatus Bandiella woodruffii]
MLDTSKKNYATTNSKNTAGDSILSEEFELVVESVEEKPDTYTISIKTSVRSGLLMVRVIDMQNKKDVQTFELCTSPYRIEMKLPLQSRWMIKVHTKDELEVEHFAGYRLVIDNGGYKLVQIN